MRAITLLVLLISMCGAQTRSTQTEVQTEGQSTGAAAAAAEISTQLDIYAELKELRDMVVELRVTLRSTQDELKKMEAENAAVKERLVASETKVGALERGLVASETKVGALERGLVASETKVGALEKVNEEQETELTAVKNEMIKLISENAAQQTELTNVKTEVMNLIKVNAAQDTRLAASETGIDNMKVENAAQEAELTAVKTRLAATETEVDNLEKMTERSKVAFSAGLTNGHIQAGSTALNLVFTKVITNVGQAYSSITGFFTAPVRGVYYFRFTVMDIDRPGWLGTSMLKNGKQVMYMSEHEKDGTRIHVSSGVTLQLEVGDAVNMQIPAGNRVFEDTNRSTFTGFLLFAL
ncbi:hypothetical protein ACEWY4_022819 [Coilia grayii]|uniref:C1q domain-containing protein n=1 Tax=Coilia grayii TaxID=363190 RepID=A0ABD1J184_9TELE